jgi:CDP-glycerol:poly(glycerophosphate) glycerophosphotransferase
MTRTATAPRLLWVIPNGSSAGNVLRSGVLARILEQVDDLGVVLLSPLAADAAFTGEFAHPRVGVESLPPHVPSGLEARLLGIVQARYLEERTTDTIRIKLAASHAGTALRYRRAKALIGRVLSPRPDSGRWYDISDRLVADPDAERVFARHRPTLVAVSTPGLIFSEIPILRTARRHRVPAMAVDLSWDNLTNKLFPIRRIDRLVVWNRTMQQEAHELHGYDLDEIAIAGPPQFDRYFNGERRSTRAEFCRRTGLDPARRILTLTTIPAEAYPRHDIVIDRLLGAIQSGALTADCDLLVRVHPRDDLRTYDRYAGTPRIVVEKPFRDSARAGDGHSVDVTVENTAHLADTMCHSDVVLNVASTIAIEASVFDTPVVNIAFDDQPGEARPFLESPLRYYSYTHYQQIVRAGAVRIATSAGEMIDLVNGYLVDPSKDAAGRRRVVAEQCEFTDGRSAERLANAMAGELLGRRAPAAAIVPRPVAADAELHANGTR